MIPDQWYAILDSRELKEDKPLGVKRLGENLVLWRSKDGGIACMRDQCLHRGAALSAGKLIDDNIQCPFHGLEFNAQGRCTYIPAYGRNTPVPKVFQAKAYPARDAFGFIWLFWENTAATFPRSGSLTHHRGLCQRHILRPLAGALFTRDRKSTGCHPPALRASQYHRQR